MARVRIDSAVYEASPGERLSDLLIRIGKAIPMPCGGRGTCGKCRVRVNGNETPACEYRVEEDIEVRLPERETIVSETGAACAEKETKAGALALDLGTTTLALALVSPENGSIIKVTTRPNPQRAYGADVMSRIRYCMEHGPAQLQRAALGAVREMLRELEAPAGLPLYVSGNTTMLHLFFGADPSPMGAAPYTPVFLDLRKAAGETLGLPEIKEAVSLPGAAAFVGADLTAGLNYVGLPPAGRYRLLIDLGTNAEIVLFSGDAALCTAAAAGPCFEGANISCGMSASPGAICAFGAEGFRTVGDKPPVGVCGTGLIDAIAALLKDGAIDESGYMEGETYELAPGVFLTQGDVRQYQLAKSAVCSAVQALVKKTGIGWDQIDSACIAGGFSAKINVENAVYTGLLPTELQEKCVAVNNSSLLGTVKFICERNDLYAYLTDMRYVDLSADPDFSALFIENMTFEEDA